MILKRKRTQDEKQKTAVPYENTVELRDITKEYVIGGGNVCRALDRVSLTVKKGEFVALGMFMDEEKRPFRCCSKEPFPKQQKTVSHHWLMRYVRRK